MKKHIWAINNCPASFVMSEFAKRNNIHYQVHSEIDMKNLRTVSYILQMTDEDASVLLLTYEGLTLRKVKW